MFDPASNLLAGIAIIGLSIWTWREPGWRGVSTAGGVAYWSVTGLAVIGLLLTANAQPLGVLLVGLWIAILFVGAPLAKRLGLTTKRWRLAETWRRLGTLSDEIRAVRSMAQIRPARDDEIEPDDPVPPVSLELEERDLVARIEAVLRSLDSVVEPETQELVDLMHEAYGHLVTGTAPKPERHVELEQRMTVLAELLPGD